MRCYKGKVERGIYVLSGVEDYLTEGAKKYKRNLMYSMFLIYVFSFIKTFNFSDGFTSIFGFALDGNKKIPIELIIGGLTLVCMYELIMLTSYVKVCNSHWFGKGLLKNKEGNNDTSEVKVFEAKFNHITYDFEALEGVINGINIHKKNFEKLAKEEYLDNFDKILNGLHGRFDSELRTLADSIRNRKKWDGEFNIEKHELILSSFEKRNVEAIETIEKHITDVKNNISGKRLLDDIQISNEEWKIYIEHQVEKNIRAYEYLSEKIDYISRPYYRVVCLEVVIPLALSVVAIIIGSCQAIPLLKVLMNG